MSTETVAAPSERALAALGASIEAAHQAATRAARATLEHAVECGRLLLEAKGQLPHGAWLAWLVAHTTIGPRQAQRYMRVATHRAEFPKCDPGTYFPIRAALAQLATPRAPADNQLVDAFFEALTTGEPSRDRLKRMSLAELVAFIKDDDAQLAMVTADIEYIEYLLDLEARMGFEPGDFCGAVARLAQACVEELEQGLEPGVLMAALIPKLADELCEHGVKELTERSTR